MAQPISQNLGEIQQLLWDWFDKNGRDFSWREFDVGTYEVVVTEILLQQTRAGSVQALYETFFSKFPSWEVRARASLDDIEVVIRPLGIWRRRANTLSKLAQKVVSLGGLPRQQAALEELPGFGQYVINAYQLCIQGMPRPLLDTNMSRVLERCIGPRQKADIRHDPYLQALAQAIVDHARSKEINWAILDLGAMVCKPRNPSCDQCPIAGQCRYYSTNK